MEIISKVGMFISLAYALVGAFNHSWMALLDAFGNFALWLIIWVQVQELATCRPCWSEDCFACAVERDVNE